MPEKVGTDGVHMKRASRKGRKGTTTGKKAFARLHAALLTEHSLPSVTQHDGNRANN